MKMPFSKLLTTQVAVRNNDQITGMADFVRRGGMFNKRALSRYAESTNTRVAPLAQINVFEDGRYVLIDGHHRGIGILEYLCTQMDLGWGG